MIYTKWWSTTGSRLVVWICSICVGCRVCHGVNCRFPTVLCRFLNLCCHWERDRLYCTLFACSVATSASGENGIACKKIEFASHRNCLYPDSCSIVVSHIIFAYPSSESNTSSTRSSVCIVSCSAPKGLACVNDLSFGWSGVCLCTPAMWFGVWCICLHAFPAADALAAWEISWLSVLLV